MLYSDKIKIEKEKQVEEIGKMFRNKERARALACYDGMSFDSLTPTDIDMVLEVGNQTLVVAEFKHGNAEVPIGQRLVIERMCTNWAKEGRHALGIIAHHNEPGDFLVAGMKVTSWWCTEKSKWVTPEIAYSVKGLIDAFLLKYPAKSKLTNRK